MIKKPSDNSTQKQQAISSSEQREMKSLTACNPDNKFYLSESLKGGDWSMSVD